ncbi:aminoacyl-histidine dipeptidase [Amantichitinum ursilacus]|uniref:Cytosol non-specific dipeptidase n=1 Tax=Amantichitinum ursilacus TaxID=857265 RepID=A0A0N0XL13_9NEIS|nr:aminoacyl-histidine dipeptidase [Amantichitinum ursilacus]KPC55152.1 Cytosol non-specific dipeptidase [Amantichitinum ursilacus]
MPLSSLYPQPLWRHFQTLCDFPRPSKHETALRDHLYQWAQARGLWAEVDEVGNLLIRKPATPGYEDRQAIVLQGHIDMVTQKNEGNPHDFFKDPILPRIEGEWVKATGTTLGADNGIGVAAGLAVLESSELQHGPIEVLLTIDEEAGMTGVKGLRAGWLQAQILLNLDTEDWGELYLGCAGGVDVVVSRPLAHEPVPAGYEVFKLTVKGLRGGHSGVDIHQERGNANKLLARILNDVLAQGPAHLVSFEGGTLRNALPREAFALVALPGDAAPALAGSARRWQARLAKELARVDDNVTVLFEPAEAAEGLSVNTSRQVIDLLLGLPYGVARWSQAVPGVVESSNNLGVVRVNAEGFKAALLVRSLTDEGVDEVSSRIEAVARMAGAQTERSGGYPGWAPDPSSAALALVQKAYRERYGHDAELKVIHAGLETGLIAGKYPDLAMVSFGPTIRGAHSPDEGVEIATVGYFWELLVDALKAVPARV